MRRINQVIIALFAGIQIFVAQDQLYKKDNTKILVKIIEIGAEDIKYKLFNNPEGPTYTEPKSLVNLVIFENGKHESFNVPTAVSTETFVTSTTTVVRESYNYYTHPNNISLNFLNFFNNEVGLLFQRDFVKSQFNIVIPIAFGLEKPGVTQSVYFQNRNNNYVYNYDGNYFQLDKKLFEVGFGINYYPSLATNINYYIGPAFRFMQYGTTQNAVFYDQPTNTTTTVTYKSNLNRYCVSITNGVILRTKSRLTLNMFGSLGFKNDQMDDYIINPYTNIKLQPINNAFSLYFWCGINVGFNF